jgi:hypothetical protein
VDVDIEFMNGIVGLEYGEKQLIVIGKPPLFHALLEPVEIGEHRPDGVFELLRLGGGEVVALHIWKPVAPLTILAMF